MEKCWPLRLDVWLADLRRPLHDRAQIDALLRQLHLASRDAGDVQQVVDQACLQLDVAAGHLQVLTALAADQGAHGFSAAARR